MSVGSHDGGQQLSDYLLHRLAQCAGCGGGYLTLTIPSVILFESFLSFVDALIAATT
ncbi:MAG: hypothetical protein U0894_00500 [Pirellulales bacterium]